VTTADEAGVDDVTFLRAIIDWSAGQHGTWPDRAVVAGVSNGAFMAHRLALEASDQVAVLAAVAGGMSASLHDIEPAHAVSALLIHGTADTISPIGGGFSRHLGPNGELHGRTLSLDETASRWRTIDRCPPDGTGIGGTRVTTHIIDGGGHTWPDDACRRELLDRTLIWNQSHLRHSLREFEHFYNRHRPHQGIANARPLELLPAPLLAPDQIASLDIRRRDRLGGVFHECQHAA
jgi:poly(3-hydroxybutyrate) depolymerase